MKITPEQKVQEIEKHIALKKKELVEWRKLIKPKEVKNFTFKNWENEEVSLRECFGKHNELILVYNMGKSCVYCTLWGDNYNGITKPLNDRAAFVVVSPDSPKKQKKFAKSRNWKFKMLSHKNTSFVEEMNMQQKGDNAFMTNPGVSSFVLKDDKIFHLNKSFFGPGDNFCNMLDFIDLLPKRENEWRPKYDYK